MRFGTWNGWNLYRAGSLWEDSIKMDLQEVGCGGLAGSMWLRIGTGGGHW